MTTFKANRKFPNPITVTDDPKSHTLALQQIIEALNIGQRRTKEVNSSYVRVHELVDAGLIEIVGNQLKLTNTGTGGGVVDHNALENLQGGGVDEYYHLTAADHAALSGTGVADGDKGDIVVSSSGTVWMLDSGVCTTAGRDLLDDATAADQRTTLGLGTAATAATTAFEASGAIATHAALTETHGISTFGASLVDDTTAADARTTLGLGTAATSAATAFAASGDVTASGATMATAKMLGRSTAATGAIEEIAVGSGLSLSAGTLTATGGTPFIEGLARDFLLVYEDFVSGIGTAGANGWDAVVSSGSASTIAGAVAGRPGVLTLSTGTTTTGYSGVQQGIAVGGAVGSIKIGGGVIGIDILWRISNTLPTTANMATIRLGLMDEITSDPGSGIYLAFVDDAGTIKVVGSCENGNVISSTATGSGIAVATNTWYHGRIEINADASSVEFFHDGTSLGAVTTNIPTADLSPALQYAKSTGTTSITLHVDAIKLLYTFTTPRWT